MSLIEEIEAARESALDKTLQPDWREQVDKAYEVAKACLIAQAELLKDNDFITTYGQNSVSELREATKTFGPNDDAKYRLLQKKLEADGLEVHAYREAWGQP